MAFTFPLALGDLNSQLHKTSINFHPVYNQAISGLGSGKTAVVDTAPMYWAADVTLINMSNDDWRKVLGVFLTLNGSLNDFYMYDPRFAYPAFDPDGSILGSSTITNSNVDSAKVMDLTGFPPGYQLNAGDAFSFNFGPSNAYRAYHILASGGTANGSGNINNVEFRPPLADPDLSTGKTMDFKLASCRMKVDPGSFDPGSAKLMMSSGFTFKCRQVVAI